MARESRFSSNDPAQRLQALSRWDNEGGAIPVGPFVNPASGEEPIDIPELTNAELVALRIRVIALENLLISLLSTATDHQLEVARERRGIYLRGRVLRSTHSQSTQRHIWSILLNDRCVSAPRSRDSNN